MSTDLLKISRKEGLFHVLFWTLFFASLIIGESAPSKMFFDHGFTFMVFTLIIPVYLNAFILIPKYLKRSKVLHYALALIIMLLGVNVIKAFFMISYLVSQGYEIVFTAEFEKWVFRDFRFLHKFIFSGTMIILYVSFAYRFIKDWVINERIKEKLISEKLTMELALLKSQVNPHFLFNTLNNVYATALEENATNTADSIAKLGTLMRYGLHDAQVDFILLSKEIAYIEQYVDMQKLRSSDSDKINLDVNVVSGDINSQKIAPMILMPFIENAFKYGLSTIQKSKIDIKISISEGVLSLEVENVISNNQMTGGGVGLMNVESRLRMIYPHKYTLGHAREDNVYKVDLKITL